MPNANFFAAELGRRFRSRMRERCTGPEIGALEQDAEDFDSESWRDVVPRIKEGAESVRGALDNLKKALGYSS